MINLQRILTVQIRFLFLAMLFTGCTSALVAPSNPNSALNGAPSERLQLTLPVPPKVGEAFKIQFGIIAPSERVHLLLNSVGEDLPVFVQTFMAPDAEIPALAVAGRYIIKADLVDSESSVRLASAELAFDVLNSDSTNVGLPTVSPTPTTETQDLGTATPSPSPSISASPGSAVTPPTAVSYSVTTLEYEKGIAIAALVPQISGGSDGVLFTSVPGLPAGIQLNATTGEITGTPTAASAMSAYRIIATNAGGSTETTLNIAIWKEQLDTSAIVVESATLPYIAGWGAARVVGDYVYLFGGQPGAWGTDSPKRKTIQRAPVNNPTNWQLLPDLLPVMSMWVPTIVVGDFIYIFGTIDFKRKILRAPVSTPTSWTDTGAVLPGDAFAHSVLKIGDYIYLFGGGAGSSIYRAPVADPLTWSDTSVATPAPAIYRSMAVIGNYVYLYATNTYRASFQDPLVWEDMGPSGLGAPGMPDCSPLLVIGDDVFILGGHDKSAIYRAPKSNPIVFTDTGHDIPLNGSGKGGWGADQVVRINNKVYFFGGLTSSYLGSNSIRSIPINKSYID